MDIDIRNWSDGDLELGIRLMGDPEMTRYLGGREPIEQIRRRHQRYVKLRSTGDGRMYVIVVGLDQKPAGSVGFWQRQLHDQTVWETGWSVLPEYQGMGIATSATVLAIEQARNEGSHRFMHAFPSIENAPSNAICRKLGFTLLGVDEYEFPPGNLVSCNDWRLDLFPSRKEV